MLWRLVSMVFWNRLTAARAVAALVLLTAPSWADDSSLFKSPVFKTYPINGITDVPAGWQASAFLYNGSLNTSADNQFTTAHVEVTGGIAAIEYRFPWLSIAVLGNFGHTHVMYLQVLQDTFASSAAIGVRGRAYLGPLTFTLSTSTAEDKYQTVLQTAANAWDGAERAIYGSVAADLNAGAAWLVPFAGARYLALTQDAHMLGGAIGGAAIPEETRHSQLAFAGARVELRLRDDRNNLITPWLFGGVSHEYEDIPPMGPSVFITEGMAGNQYTLFPPGMTNVPALFPGRTTQAFGAGVNVDFAKVFTVNGGIYRELNAEFASTTYKLGAALRW
jgi:hypothetical protein